MLSWPRDRCGCGTLPNGSGASPPQDFRRKADCRAAGRAPDRRAFGDGTAGGSEPAASRSAEEAAAIGLINEVISKETIAAHVASFAQKLCAEASAESLAVTKEMLTKVASMELNEALDYAAHMNATARSGEDCKKGIGAFVRKEKISW